MERKFWATRGRKRVGPFATREEALAAFRTAYPFKGPNFQATAKANQILTGFGEFGPGFSIQWDDARENARS